uniref:Uncharacterized protein n=1 Tax=Steinernema glaseri TaxID=37863 RepID=A0A1I7Z0P9_9BILA
MSAQALAHEEPLSAKSRAGRFSAPPGSKRRRPKPSVLANAPEEDRASEGERGGGAICELAVAERVDAARTRTQSVKCISMRRGRMAQEESAQCPRLQLSLSSEFRLLGIRELCAFADPISVRNYRLLAGWGVWKIGCS